MKKQFIFIISLITLTYACKENNESGEQEMANKQEMVGPLCVTEQQFASSEFKWGNLEKKSFSNQIDVNGKIHVPEKNRASVISYIGGKVSRFDLIEGQKIRKGQYLFSLSGPQIIDLQNNYLAAKSRLEFLTSEYERQQQLSAENITTRKELARIKGEKQAIEAEFAALGQKLALIGIKGEAVSAGNLKSSIGIYAPISAIVSEINITLGSYLTEGVKALELLDPDHLHLELYVLEKDGNDIKVGQNVKFSTVNNPDKEFDAEIYMINRKIDDHRMIKVHCHFEDELNNQFYPDMYATGKVMVGQHESWALPEKAIVRSEGNSFVLINGDVREDGYVCFAEMALNIGKQHEGYIEIIDPPKALQEADILVEGAYFVSE